MEGKQESKVNKERWSLPAGERGKLHYSCAEGGGAGVIINKYMEMNGRRRYI
jgi:hypothetical protein